MTGQDASPASRSADRRRAVNDNQTTGILCPPARDRQPLSAPARPAKVTLPTTRGTNSDHLPVASASAGKAEPMTCGTAILPGVVWFVWGVGVWGGAPPGDAGKPRTWGPGLSCEVVFGGVLLSHTLSSAVPSALAGLASGFGMGPGVSLPLWPP
jgi:hypothetical protein